jgi:5-methyltetrahydrofolate--homocysteine methyltransferase
LNNEELFERIRNSIVNFDVEGIKSQILDAVKLKISPGRLIKVMGEGMDVVGEKYQLKEFFIPELIMAGETMKEALTVLKPYMTEEAKESLGTVIMATVKGDLHDIGKNIFIMLLNTAGFKVVDLGIDVLAEAVVEAVKEYDADIVGLSALLTTNLEQMPLIIDKLEKAGLRDQVKVIIGGATVTEEFAKQIGADGYAKEAVKGIGICKKWVQAS